MNSNFGNVIGVGGAAQQVPLAKEWNLWLDDYILLQREREIVRDIARTREEVLQDDQIKELSLAKKMGMDWKAKYRLRHNWYRGSSVKTQMGPIDPPSNPHIHGLCSRYHNVCLSLPLLLLFGLRNGD